MCGIIGLPLKAAGLSKVGDETKAEGQHARARALASLTKAIVVALQTGRLAVVCGITSADSVS